MVTDWHVQLHVVRQSFVVEVGFHNLSRTWAVSTETDPDVFDIFWNSDRNSTDIIQTMVRTLLTIAGFSVLYRIVW